MEEGQTEEKEEEWTVGRGQEGVSETETERLMGQDAAAEEDRPEVERGEKREEEKQETAEERGHGTKRAPQEAQEHSASRAAETTVACNDVNSCASRQTSRRRL